MGNRYMLWADEYSDFLHGTYSGWTSFSYDRAIFDAVGLGAAGFLSDASSSLDNLIFEASRTIQSFEFDEALPADINVPVQAGLNIDTPPIFDVVISLTQLPHFFDRPDAILVESPLYGTHLALPDDFV